MARVQQPRVEEVEAPVEGVGEGAPEAEAAEGEAAAADEGGSES